MKGVINMQDLEFIENDYVVRLTPAEYKYVSKLCNTMYNTLKKFPKKSRTPKFYLLESLINNVFNEK